MAACAPALSYLGGDNAKAHSVLLFEGHSDDFRFFTQRLRLGMKKEVY